MRSEEQDPAVPGSLCGEQQQVMLCVWGLHLAEPSPGAAAEGTEQQRWKESLMLRIPRQLSSNINRLHGELCSALGSRKDGQRSKEAREVASTVHSLHSY